MSYSPESSWVIQDLEVMYPPERNQLYPVKPENNMDNCSYATSAGSRPPQAGSGTMSYSTDNAYNGNVSYSGSHDSYHNSTPEWPADLENIVLPTECDSPLKLEDVEYFIYNADPSTLESSNFNVTSTTNIFQNPTCSPLKYSNPPGMAPIEGRNAHHPLIEGRNTPHQPCFDQLSNVENSQLTALRQDVTSVPDQGQGRVINGRGRPRAEWRIQKNGKRLPGRPRGKTGRKPTLGVVKTEIIDDEYRENMYPDVVEEKRERRREQNRRAARKLREKKKVHVENMRCDYDHVLQENRRLTSEVEELRRMVQELQDVKQGHVCVCREGFTPSPGSSTSSGAIYGTNAESRNINGSPAMTSLMTTRITSDLAQTAMER